MPPAPPKLPPTERLHPRSRDLGALPLRGALRLLHRGDEEAVRAVTRALPALGVLVTLGAEALRGGGRIVYVGAGTSARLAALDAAECPPTFGTRPSQVVALVAGGARGLRRAVEGAEDDTDAGRAAIERSRLRPRDLVVGVSASGTTPFVRAALAEARARGAATALVTCNPAAGPRVAARVVLDTGPELVAGSTRMKAGCATKMALSIFSTAVMLRLGRVEGGRMLDLVPTSAKLRRRAIRMVMELTGRPRGSATAALEATGWSVRRAVALGRRPSRKRRRS